MEYFVYILYSTSLDRYYTGQTDDLEDRLFRHNNSGSKATKAAKDWKLMYKEIYFTRSESVKRESEIKRKKSRKYIEELIKNAKRPA